MLWALQNFFIFKLNYYNLTEFYHSFCIGVSFSWMKFKRIVSAKGMLITWIIVLLCGFLSADWNSNGFLQLCQADSECKHSPVAEWLHLSLERWKLCCMYWWYRASADFYERFLISDTVFSYQFVKVYCWIIFGYLLNAFALSLLCQGDRGKWSYCVAEGTSVTNIVLAIS